MLIIQGSLLKFVSFGNILAISWPSPLILQLVFIQNLVGHFHFHSLAVYIFICSFHFIWIVPYTMQNGVERDHVVLHV